MDFFESVHLFKPEPFTSLLTQTRKMLKTILQSSTHSPSFLISCSQSPGPLHWPTKAPSSSVSKRRARKSGSIRCNAAEEAQTAVFAATVKTPPVKAVVTVMETVGGIFAHTGITRGEDDIIDLLGKTMLLELVSMELDPKTGLEKETIQAFAHRAGQHRGSVHYEASFTVPMGFGEIGAVLVINEHHKEMFLEEIVLTTGDATTAKTISCKSWVHSKFDSPIKRIFFTSKCYLPSQTPGGLLNLRQKELENLRGDGTGMRKAFERIYDYDTYNDLGDPDKGIVRPILGGSKVLPYPRRCRTGRPKTKTDPLSEQRATTVYVPRDEAFSEVKQISFSTKTLRSVVHALIPSIESAIIDPNLSFPYFTAIDSLFNEGVAIPMVEGKNVFNSVIPRLIKAIEETKESILLFETPAIIDRDKFSWFRDEEFSRQLLAGLNPVCIQLVKEFPLVSKLDPTIYGTPESAITKEIVEKEIKGFSTVDQAVKEKRLFVLDYHDLLLPYVLKVRELEGSTLYGSRTIFFLTPDDTLRPVAIELTRPPSPTKPEWKKVFTHNWDATGTWLWRLAKTHVIVHDSGVHQLVSHWLRTHCCTEPYIIAANRQLSAIHPIYRLLHPHFRYTMEINALARESLINADGVIEKTFFPAKYASEMSSVAYRELWRFDTEALPNDLIARGMAVRDPTAEHGLRLSIKDYPYANDGLLIWSSIKEWVTDYVSHYYPAASDILGDVELQAWWTEVRTKGHADKKDEPWWPQLNTQTDLIEILTTIIWVVSGHHAAVNFGQYHYAGYFPNRPTIARSNMPVEDENDGAYERFIVKPESALLSCFPSQTQATIVMSVLDILSNHSPDEEYLGKDPEPAWAENPAIAAAFQKFSGRMLEIDGIIDQRNLDPERRNRFGAGIVPYELLKPFSKPGVTGMGVPNSISI